MDIEKIIKLSTKFYKLSSDAIKKWWIVPTGDNVGFTHQTFEEMAKQIVDMDGDENKAMEILENIGGIKISLHTDKSGAKLNIYTKNPLTDQRFDFVKKFIKKHFISKDLNVNIHTSSINEIIYTDNEQFINAKSVDDL